MESKRAKGIIPIIIFMFYKLVEEYFICISSLPVWAPTPNQVFKTLFLICLHK